MRMLKINGNLTNAQLKTKREGKTPYTIKHCHSLHIYLIFSIFIYMTGNDSQMTIVQFILTLRMKQHVSLCSSFWAFKLRRTFSTSIYLEEHALYKATISGAHSRVQTGSKRGTVRACRTSWASCNNWEGTLKPQWVLPLPYTWTLQTRSERNGQDAILPTITNLPTDELGIQYASMAVQGSLEQFVYSKHCFNIFKTAPWLPGFL